MRAPEPKRNPRSSGGSGVVWALLGLCLTAASCAFIAPRTTKVLEPVQDELLVAVLIDLDRLISAILGVFLW